jgi:hypothetical protein
MSKPRVSNATDRPKAFSSRKEKNKTTKVKRTAINRIAMLRCQPLDKSTHWRKYIAKEKE